MLKKLAIGLNLFYFALSNFNNIAVAQNLNKLDEKIAIQEKKAFNLLLKNISVSDAKHRGFIIAAPSKEPNYYYHWVRDAALVMNSVFDSLSHARKVAYFLDYASIVNIHQTNPYNISSLGEVKYNPDGTAFSGPWGRPQNDGPALRASVLIKFTNYLLDNNFPKSFIEKKLYKAEMPATSPIKMDLEYISKEWENPDYDLWEEVYGTHFFTKMVQRTALYEGAKLAERMDDPYARDYYLEIANKIDKFLNNFYDNKTKLIKNTLNQQGGHTEKISNIDASIILAANYASLKNMNYSIDDYRILNTFKKLVTIFKNIYPINKRDQEVGIGRYPEDYYFKGNPWFLLTLGFGEYLNNLAINYIDKKEININQDNMSFFKFVGASKINIKTYKNDSTEFKLIISSLKNYSDLFAKTVLSHIDIQTGQMDEQYSKENGYMLSAAHLTWSYAAYNTFAISRKKLTNLLLQK